MPLVVTDADVLAQIALDDAAAARIQAQIAALGAKVPAQTLTSWNADAASYAAWSKAAKERLAGGFILGEWVGVPADGNSAVAWQNTFTSYQSILSQVAAGQTPTTLTPPAQSVGGVSDANTGTMVKGATGAVASVAGSVEGPIKWLAIGLAAVAVGAIVLKK